MSHRVKFVGLLKLNNGFDFFKTMYKFYHNFILKRLEDI